MKTYQLWPLLGVMLIAACSTSQKVMQQTTVAEQYRPQFHFSPKANWMNDPNGMVYLNGTYHLFFQYNPGGTTWGPMHWGHATSSDLIHWTEQPIALYPDSLGTIFSGSAVVDKDNTAGFGKNAIIAIFTHHNQKIEEAKTGLHQYQSIAYSTDEGKTWAKYKGNPVLPNPGIWDFRDPKVQWYEAGKKWLMTLATKDRITFYSSPNLKTWTKESEFGEKLGAHGGVWECPDLISLDYNGTKKWVLLVSINPGGPTSGSATQYFVGNFDGKTFVPDNTSTRWVDYGADDYAGVTFSNTGNRRIFIGWMTNWNYANVVPTKAWRSAMTIPRELKLKDVNGTLHLAAEPVSELAKITGPSASLENVTVNGDYDLSPQVSAFGGKYLLNIELANLEDITLHLSNAKGNEVLVGYDKASNTYYVDRTRSGDVGFEQSFARKTTAPRIAAGEGLSIKLLVDVASAEVFTDDGLSVLTNIFFPQEPLNQLHITSTGPLKLKKITYSGVKPSIR
ncbi:glycoside hydrolase family 32 protein [Mucilaginibacter sp. ZT4R22]|uniref:Glycoside hydrolase family 32 protein n=1 Tax=Mucilaginibacter pankratovii TaxID=2772110 RepID=A0ABR7WJ87_9SPHI|nr:glycoside hydrolase family 32 protein [Mucilaginibacter pankratovii]MBD1362394.1 glycoside hydrolase family 32 protein [Mucilaginibacter pankratovii]